MTYDVFYINKRGFEVAKGFKNSSINLPRRSTTYSAAYDLESAETIVLKPNTVTVISTGIKAYMGQNEVLKIYIRSSLGFKKNLVLANQVGIIDSDYYGNPDNDGHIMIAIRNLNDEEITINKGDRIAQGIFEEYLTIDDDQPIDKKRISGIGSTGI